MGPTDHWGLAERRLYLCSPDRPDLEPFVEACIQGGVDIVQLREKHLDDHRLVERATSLQRVCADHQVPFILNDRPELAASIGADGVHVGQDDMSPAATRRMVGEGSIIGLSTHAPAELDAAIGIDGRGPAPVDYISAGPVTATPTKPGRPGTGIDYVREAVQRALWPVWITGGVDPDTVGPLITAGARHFVVVRWLTEASHPLDNARLLRRTIDEAIAASEEPQP
jgi:thiamine-phosphate pyrophosphorylase